MMLLTYIVSLLWIIVAVADSVAVKGVLFIQQCRSKGRSRGGPCPPQFFFLKVKTDLYKMLKIKYYQATVWEVFKKRPADEVYVCL